MKAKKNDARIYEKSYQHWKKMRSRCYNIKELNKKKCYRNVLICDEWQDYEKYKIWYNEHYVDGWQIDKDLLSNDEKIYSPQTCCFLPKELNSFLSSFTKNGTSKSPLIGIYIRHNKYCAQYRTPEKIYHLGTFKSLEEAKNVHNTFKKQRLLEYIEKYKDQLEPRVLDALLKFSEKNFG